MLEELLAHPRVMEETVLAGDLGFMAIHGGLEQGTAGMARRLAAAVGGSLYVVEQPDDLAWHIPSTLYEPASSTALSRFIGHVRTVVSIHGFGRRHLQRSVLVGGRNTDLAARLAEAIRQGTELRVVDDPAQIPHGLRGLHPRNPVNLPPEAGVQLELSPSARVDPDRAVLIDALRRSLAHDEAARASS